ncbi:unnamed protein product [Urochloa humidicola]
MVAYRISLAFSVSGGGKPARASSSHELVASVAMPDGVRALASGSGKRWHCMGASAKGACVARSSLMESGAICGQGKIFPAVRRWRGKIRPALRCGGEGRRRGPRFGSHKARREETVARPTRFSQFL